MPKPHSPFTTNFEPLSSAAQVRSIQILAASVILQALNDATRELPSCLDRHFTANDQRGAAAFLTSERYRADREFWCHIVDVPEARLRKVAAAILEGASP